MEPLKTIYETSGGGSDHYSVNSLVFNITTNSSSASKAMMSYYSQLANGMATPAEDFYCYVGGEGKNFTLSNVTKYDYGFFSYTLITIVSGTLDGDKVINLHFASVELDEEGEIEEVGIGTDDDGISTPTTWEPGADDEDYWSVRRKTAHARRMK